MVHAGKMVSVLIQITGQIAAQASALVPVVTVIDHRNGALIRDMDIIRHLMIPVGSNEPQWRPTISDQYSHNSPGLKNSDCLLADAAVFYNQQAGY